MISRKTIILIIVGLTIVIFFMARSVLMPFILAGIFAYVFGPVVDLGEKQLKLPRFWVIALLYSGLFILALYFSHWLLTTALNESRDFTRELDQFNSFRTATFDHLPEWVVGGQHFGVKPVVEESIKSAVLAVGRFQGSLLPLFSQIIRYGLSFLVFWVAAFYLLKDSKHLFEATVKKFPAATEKEIREVGKRINVVLGGYLRGQIILILLMASVSSIFLTILGVKFAIVLGVLTGFLELIPFVGPVIATTLAAGVAFITGTNNFGFEPVVLSLIVISAYFIFRQLEDYFIIPQVLGRLTRIHPLFVLLSILIGGAIAGPIGFILGVPFAVSGKVLLEYFWEKGK